MIYLHNIQGDSYQMYKEKSMTMLQEYENLKNFFTIQKRANNTTITIVGGDMHSLPQNHDFIATNISFDYTYLKQDGYSLSSVHKNRALHVLQIT